MCKNRKVSPETVTILETQIADIVDGAYDSHLRHIDASFRVNGKYGPHIPEPVLSVSYITGEIRLGRMTHDFRYRSTENQTQIVRTVLNRLVRMGILASSIAGNTRAYEPANYWSENPFSWSNLTKSWSKA